MSQLQIGLISLGALIILGVLLFNWSQERRIRREMVRRFDGPIDDVLMQEFNSERQAEPPLEDFRIDHEAVLELHKENTVAEPAVAEEEVESAPEWKEAEPEPVAVEIAVESPVELPAEEEELPKDDILVDEFPPESVSLNEPEPAAPIELPAAVDPQIDEIAIATFNQPCSGLSIRDALLPLPEFDKPVRWLGLSADGTAQLLTKEHEQTQFSRIIGALQLADRSGPANGSDLRNFHAKVEDLVARLGGALEWREHPDPLQHARELDQFCIEVDVMINFHLIAGGEPFAGTKLRGLAEAAGLVLKDDGQFHQVSSEGTTLFTLASLDRQPFTADRLRTSMLRGVVLMMDVPRVANGSEVFNQMVLFGRKLETALVARLTDENQKTLGDAEIEKIRQQLKAIYARMLARGIESGGITALRLFS